MVVKTLFKNKLILFSPLQIPYNMQLRFPLRQRRNSSVCRLHILLGLLPASSSYSLLLLQSFQERSSSRKNAQRASETHERPILIKQ